MLLLDLHGELWPRFTTRNIAGLLVHVYNTHPLFERGNNGQNYAYCNRICTVCSFEGGQFSDKSV